MNSKITIKRKINVGFSTNDKEMLDDKSDFSYIGFIFIYYNTPKPKNPKKILLNHSYIYLKNRDQFTLVKVNYSNSNINNNFVTQYIKDNYNIDKVKLLKQIYSTKNLHIYIVNLNNKKIEIENFSWKTYLDFYTYDYDSTFDDIYYNIIFKSNNLHLNHKFYTNNYIRGFVKLRKIYENLIADNIVKHDIIKT